ncbi:OS9 protein, partial [Vireo altiloquus]|nr:OS9 protein [Vireo altiloquus]
PISLRLCSRQTKDWWTYEFCYGRHIQQYHLEESEIKGDILVLGYYQSAFDWDDETAKVCHRGHREAPGVRPGVTLAPCPQFLCEEGTGDYIARVDEPQSCSYVLTVHTTRICHHPFLRPAPGLAPQPIRCQPALSPAQYVQYVRAQVSDTKRKVEEISEELRSLDTRLWSDKDSEGSQDGMASVPMSPPPPGTPSRGHGAASASCVPPCASSVPPSARDTARASQGCATWGPGGDNPRKKIHFKVIRSPGDLLQFIEELKETTRKVK